MTDPTDISPEDSALAAEYALGLLEADDAHVFRARLVAEPALAAEVAAWEVQFAVLAEDEVAEITPPAAVARRIERALFPDADPAPALLGRLAFWRAVSGFSTLAAAALAVVVFLPETAPPGDAPSGIPPGTLLMTHLIPTEDSDLGLAFTREPDGALQVRRVAGSATPDRAQQLWLIVGDDAPISLGLLDEDPLTTLRPSPQVDALFGAGAVVAISDEPPGGSPTGAPTGDILAVGELLAL